MVALALALTFALLGGMAALLLCPAWFYQGAHRRVWW